MSDLAVVKSDRWEAIWILIVSLLLISCYGMISHDFDASIKMSTAEDMFENDENDSADRAQTGQITSKIGYLSLGMAGLASCLFTTARTRRVQSWLVVLLVVYLMWISSTILWSVNMGMSVRKIPIALLVATSTFGLSRHLALRNIPVVVILVTTAYLFSGLFAEVVQGMFRPWRSTYRFSGMVHPNEQAMYAALLVLGAWFWKAEASWKLWLRIACILIGLVAIYFTKSRTTLGAMGLAIFLAEIVRATPVKRIVYLLTATCVLSVGGLVASSAGLWENVGSAAAMGRTEHVTSLTGRVPLWGELWKQAESRLLLGHGYGAFWDANMVREMSGTFYWEIMNAHSIYLDALLASGLVGLALYLSLLTTSLAVSTSLASRTGESGYLFVVAVLLFAFIHGFAESKFLEEGLGTYFLMLSLLTLARNTKSLAQPARSVIATTTDVLPRLTLAGRGLSQ